MLRVDGTLSESDGLDWFESRVAYPDWAAEGSRPPVSFFPTCQVRVVRFCVSCRAPPPPAPPPPPQPRVSDGSVLRQTSTASSGLQCSPPDLNRQLQTAVFPTGPQPQVQDGSVPRRTSTASSGRQRSPPDINRRLRMAAFPAGPQPRVLLRVFPAGSQPRVKRYVRRYAR